MFDRRHRPARIFLGLLALVAGIAGCGGSSNNTTPQIIACTLPAGTFVAQIYPVPGATLVPDTLGEVILAINPPLPVNGSWQILLLNPTATYAGGGLQSNPPLPLPSPLASIPPGTTLQYSVFNNTGGLQSNSVFQVALNNNNSNCNNYPTFGSFTSQ